MRNEENIRFDTIIKNNKSVPFVKEIMAKKFKSVLVSGRFRGKDIVLPGDVEPNQAKKSGNYIAFDTKAEADFFIQFYRFYEPVTDEKSSLPPRGKKYTVVIKESSKDGKYTAVVIEK